MKPEDVKFVRAQWGVAALSKDALYEVSIRKYCETVGRLLSLLIESEAMREKADFRAWHTTLTSAPTTRRNCRHAFGQGCVEEHDYNDAAWIADIKKRWGLE